MSESGAAELEAELRRYLRHLTIERGLSKNTLLAYERDLNRYTQWLVREERTELGAITPAHIGEFSAGLRDDEGTALAASSVARVLSSVRSFHRFLVDEGTIERDSAKEVRPPKLPGRLPKALTIDNMQKLLDSSPSDSPLALRDRALLELLYASGARISEVVGLNVDDVLDDAEFVRVTGKGSKQRIVPVGRYAREAIESYLVRVRPEYSTRGKATPALFLGIRGSRLSRQGAWLIIQAAAERAGLDGHVSPHTFRHSFATHLLQGGADVRVVQELLGHSSVTTTQIYTHVTADALRDVYASSHPRAQVQ